MSVLTEERIVEAEDSLKKMLNVDTLVGKSFLDIGSGSGLFSLAARRLGAKVVSFDYDSQSYACTKELKQRYFKEDDNWTVEQGSVLEPEYIKSLGQFDIVYSWGVLHHTGHMWDALENVDTSVAPNGKLFVSLYNDQGIRSKLWLRVKQLYVTLPKMLRFIILGPSLVWFWGPKVIRDMFRGNPLHSWINYKKKRGMSAWYDVVDWVGGLPFEVSKPEEIFEFYKEKGYRLEQIKTCAGKLGCNEYVFTKLS